MQFRVFVFRQVVQEKTIISRMTVKTNRLFGFLSPEQFTIFVHINALNSHISYIRPKIRNIFLKKHGQMTCDAL